jgi:hypothetical protein
LPLIGTRKMAFRRRDAWRELAEAGCTEAEIASITGHSIKSVGAILDRYLARTKGLALSAIEKLEKSKRRTDSSEWTPECADTDRHFGAKSLISW